MRVMNLMFACTAMPNLQRLVLFCPLGGIACRCHRLFSDTPQPASFWVEVLPLSWGLIWVECHICCFRRAGSLQRQTEKGSVQGLSPDPTQGSPPWSATSYVHWGMAMRGLQRTVQVCPWPSLLPHNMAMISNSSRVTHGFLTYKMGMIILPA